MHTAVVPPNGAIPSGCRLPLSVGTKSGRTLTFHRVVALLPQRLSSAFKNAQVNGILTSSEISCLSVGCRCKDLAGFFAVSSIRPVLPGFSAPSAIRPSVPVPGRSYTQCTFSRKRMDPLLHVAMVFYPEHPASKVVSAFLCLGALKHSTVRSASFRDSTARLGGSAY